MILDEVSMVKSDQLYQLDLRLREVTQNPNKIFGGVFTFWFGDIMQLRPCKGRFVFEEPICTDYKLTHQCGKHWSSFEVICLEQNHRQDGDRDYADLLNRIRVGQQTHEDMTVLKSRVRREGHPDLKGAMYISCTNASVQKHNITRLNELSTELLENEAVNIHPTIKNFKPSIKEKGTIGNTAFLQNLQCKVGARVMLIHNIDVSDGLTNGTRGKLVAVEKDGKGKMKKLIIKFEEEWQGAMKRKESLALQKIHPGCTYIEKYLYQYTLAKRSTMASNAASVFQFPVTVCFAATAHKFQGGTIKKPDKVVDDLRTVFEAAMGYVMLSRNQELNQLFILGNLPEDKLYPHPKALSELERLINKSVNKNPPVWEQEISFSLKIFILNCQSILGHLSDIKSDPMLEFGDVLCFSETWLSTDDCITDLQRNGYKLHLNSVGRGNGLATYYKEDKFHHVEDIKLENMQMTKISSNELDLVSFYRSKECNKKTFVTKLVELVKQDRMTILCGDLNICLAEESENGVSEVLQQLGFLQLVNEATHFEGGHIDHVYCRVDFERFGTDCKLYSPYYSSQDHDAILVTVFKRA